MKLLIIFLYVLIFSFAAIGEEIQTQNGAIKDPDIIQQAEKQQQKSHFNFFLSAGAGIMRGNTTYQIGGNYTGPEGNGNLHFPISELKFPFDVYTANIKGGFEYNEKLRLKALFRKNITKKTGNMKDSDWGVPWEDPPGSETYYWYGPNSLDIYSESKTEVNAFILDIDFTYKFLHKNFKSTSFSLYGGIGYRHQDYNFECRLIRQWDYRQDAPPGERMDAVGDGRVGLTYDVTSYIPYIKIAPGLKKENVFSVEAGVGISPYTKIRDKDNHILRSKISKAECEGYSILLSLAGRLEILNPVFVEVTLDYICIDTEGKQKQYTNGSWSATIDQKNFSKVTSIEVSAGYVF